MNFLPVHPDDAGRVVDFKRAVREDGFRAWGLPGEKIQPSLRHTDPGKKLLYGKGLGQIIIRAGVERLYLVRILRPGADDDNRHVRPRPDLPDHIDPVHIGKPEVQQNNIRVLGSRLHYGFFSVVRRQVAVSAGLQRGGDQVTDRPVVLDSQYFDLIHDVVSSCVYSLYTGPVSFCIGVFHGLRRGRKASTLLLSCLRRTPESTGKDLVPPCLNTIFISRSVSLCVLNTFCARIETEKERNGLIRGE